MPFNDDKIAQLERDLAEAKRRRLEEHGKRFEILWAWLPEPEKRRFLDGLDDKPSRVLFGLEAAEMRGRGAVKPATGGDEICPYCGKEGLSKRGLGLHVARLHKAERDADRQAAAEEEEAVA